MNLSQVIIELRKQLAESAEREKRLVFERDAQYDETVSQIAKYGALLQTIEASAEREKRLREAAIDAVISLGALIGYHTPVYQNLRAALTPAAEGCTHTHLHRGYCPQCAAPTVNSTEKVWQLGQQYGVKNPVVNTVIEQRASLDWTAEAVKLLAGNGNISIDISAQPPVCQKHHTRMLLTVYPRPGGPDGNGWSCPECVEERNGYKSCASNGSGA